MKTLKLKMLTAAGIAATFMLVSAVPPGNEAPSSSPNGRFEKENMDIRQDLSSISMNKERIKSLKEEYKADKKADRKMEQIMDKKNLMKARADLKRDKKHLKADKWDLKRDHKLALKERKKEIRRDKEALRESRRDLNRELSNGNEARAQEQASRVVRLQNELNNDKAALERDKEDMKENMTAVNRAIRNLNDGLFSSGAVVAKSTSSTSSNYR